MFYAIYTLLFWITMNHILVTVGSVDLGMLKYDLPTYNTLSNIEIIIFKTYFSRHDRIDRKHRGR